MGRGCPRRVFGFHGLLRWLRGSGGGARVQAYPRDSPSIAHCYLCSQ
ncbi:hypothetical protein CU044_3271 [Streptomyces sp. L-9-10]|nr:hypothetical protein CU044_3271 [Streptomyces sp. L-9-10]